MFPLSNHITKSLWFLISHCSLNQATWVPYSVPFSFVKSLYREVVVLLSHPPIPFFFVDPFLLWLLRILFVAFLFPFFFCIPFRINVFYLHFIALKIILCHLWTIVTLRHILLKFLSLYFNLLIYQYISYIGFSFPPNNNVLFFLVFFHIIFIISFSKESGGILPCFRIKH